MTHPDQAPETREDALLKESGIISWNELARHFARGVVIVVSGRVDVLDVARAFSKDNKAQVEQWLSTSEIARASDDDARGWVERNPDFRCVVTAPWVLVQELH